MIKGHTHTVKFFFKQNKKFSLKIIFFASNARYPLMFPLALLLHKTAYFFLKKTVHVCLTSHLTILSSKIYEKVISFQSNETFFSLFFYLSNDKV